MPRSELLITRHRDGGGWIKARYDDPAAFAAIATVLDAKAAPLTAEDARSLPQRQADALAEVCGFVLDHADQLPHSGVRRPQLTVTVRLDDLQNRARAGCLDLGHTLTPAGLRQLCCDTGWHVRIRDGHPEFIPPKWIDPEQRPRRQPPPHLVA